MRVRRYGGRLARYKVQYYHKRGTRTNEEAFLCFLLSGAVESGSKLCQHATRIKYIKPLACETYSTTLYSSCIVYSKWYTVTYYSRHLRERVRIFRGDDIFGACLYACHE